MVEPAGAPATMDASWPAWLGVTSMMAPAGGGSGPQGLVCAPAGAARSAAAITAATGAHGG